MAAGDLTTVDAVKSWAGIHDTTRDVLIGRLITAASTHIKNVLSRDILSASYNERYDGNGRYTMVVRNYPITAISSLKIDNQTIPASPDGYANGYYFTPDAASAFRIVLFGYVFSKGILNVALAYTAGFAAVPADIAQTCVRMVTMSLKEPQYIGIKSQTLAEQTIVYDHRLWTKTVMDSLPNYERVMPI